MPDREEVMSPDLERFTYRGSDEQIALWVAGQSTHHAITLSDGSPDEQCCPDFSCCRPELLAAPEIRQAFAAGSLAVREKFLVTFLAAAFEYANQRRENDGRARIEVTILSAGSGGAS